MMHQLVGSCQKATEWVERRQMRQLSISEYTQMKIHLMICKACILYAKQSQELNQLLVKQFKVQQQSIPAEQIAEIKQDLKKIWKK